MMKERIYVRNNPILCGSYQDDDKEHMELYQDIVEKMLNKSGKRNPHGTTSSSSTSSTSSTATSSSSTTIAPAVTSAIQQNPTAIILSGPFAAGKTTVTQQFIKQTLARDPNEFAVVSVDLISDELPEFKQALDLLQASIDKVKVLSQLPPALRNKVEKNLDKYIITAETAAKDCKKRSTDISRKLLLPRILEEHRDFIYDSTAQNTQYYVTLIRKLRKLGYNVIVLYVTASLGVTRTRAEERAQVTGRRIPDEFIKKIWNRMIKKKVFESLCREADTCYLYNNQKKPIIAVEKDSDGFLKCYDLKFLEDIVNKDDCDTLYQSKLGEFEEEGELDEDD